MNPEVFPDTDVPPASEKEPLVINMQSRPDEADARMYSLAEAEADKASEKEATFVATNRARIVRDRELIRTGHEGELQPVTMLRVLADEALEHLGEACDIIDKQAFTIDCHKVHISDLQVITKKQAEQLKAKDEALDTVLQYLRNRWKRIPIIRQSNT